MNDDLNMDTWEKVLELLTQAEGNLKEYLEHTDREAEGYTEEQWRHMQTGPAKVANLHVAITDWLEGVKERGEEPLIPAPSLPEMTDSIEEN